MLSEHVGTGYNLAILQEPIIKRMQNPRYWGMNFFISVFNWILKVTFFTAVNKWYQ